jgi:hypothetical protein
MSNELKALIYKLSKDTKIPAYQIITAVKKTIKSGRLKQKELILIFEKLVN